VLRYSILSKYISKTILKKEIGRFRRTGKDVTARENVEEGIEVVGVRTIEPAEEHLCVSTRDARENLKRRVGRSVGTRLTAHHDNTSVGQN
jgi:hypothetical protein